MLCPGWWLVQANQTGWNTVGLKSTLVHSAIILYYWIHKSTTTWHLKLLHNRFLYMCFVGRTLLVIETFVFFSHTNPMLFFFSEPNSINNFVRLSSSLIGAAKAMKPNIYNVVSKQHSKQSKLWRSQMCVITCWT